MTAVPARRYVHLSGRSHDTRVKLNWLRWLVISTAVHRNTWSERTKVATYSAAALDSNFSKGQIKIGLTQLLDLGVLRSIVTESVIN